MFTWRYLIIISFVLFIQLLFQHNLFLVSFASAGDADTPDFICYVAKTDQDTRMCYVFECSDGLAQDVIITIGQAFQLGYQVNINTNSHLRIVMGTCPLDCSCSP